MSKYSKRLTSALAASALGLAGVIVAPTLPAAADEVTCAPGTTKVSILSYNDFHGRILQAPALFTAIEKIRDARGQANVGLVSSGDDIGGSTFESMADDDFPTLRIMAAADLDAVAVGNHEFDKGWSDLAGRVHAALPFQELGANVYTKGTTDVAPPLKSHEIFEVGGLRVAVIGAVTADLPSLVSPSGLAEVTIGDPVEAINRVAASLPADVDLVMAAVHEGAPNGSSDGASQAALSPNFNAMWTGIDPRVKVVLNGHTHQSYAWTNDKGQLFTQAASYATQLNELTACVTADGQLSGEVGNVNHVIDPKAVDPSHPRVAEIQKIVKEAVDKANEVGKKVIGTANQAISTPTGNADVRNVESPMSNAVAQLFFDTLSKGNPEFIGIQNPGGTRDSFDQGDITYREAALALPFANTLMTTQITGAQFKTVLEQQWQRKADGTVPSRPFLRLGLSRNVSYTYDESRPEGDRITSIFVAGKPIDPAKLYTVGSGSFLIAGGDNFFELAKGTGTKDSGRVDLEAWIAWVTANQPLSPDHSKRGVSMTAAATELKEGGAATTFTFDVTAAEPVSPEGLDMMLGKATGRDPKDPAKVTPAVPNTKVTVTLDGSVVGTGTVADGKASVEVSVPSSCTLDTREAVLTFTIEPSGTVVHRSVRVQGDGVACTTPEKPGKPVPPRPGDPRPGLPRTGAGLR
ncbi:bifunctional UDP-sugar hydrolase/5'-nucleotidase [Arachnia propionica]|uniref:Bifunctional metallophosphatase/5'-nucleotidase n=1 Tax=Arachnia propionica TaxID=1750 RepID=A0A3P1WUX0_9ACTN|nr:bifunctional UDP-sugar hydrolase/5'-nucleotidase [Arachnia propionica]RRD50424.1 bifunctional metallophosphatase/5'-nucleotidase [Arachnia propionica]